MKPVRRSTQFFSDTKPDQRPWTSVTHFQQKCSRCISVKSINCLQRAPFAESFFDPRTIQVAARVQF